MGPTLNCLDMAATIPPWVCLWWPPFLTAAYWRTMTVISSSTASRAASAMKVLCTERLSWDKWNVHKMCAMPPFGAMIYKMPTMCAVPVAQWNMKFTRCGMPVVPRICNMKSRLVSVSARTIWKIRQNWVWTNLIRFNPTPVHWQWCSRVQRQSGFGEVCSILSRQGMVTVESSWIGSARKPMTSSPLSARVCNAATKIWSQNAHLGPSWFRLPKRELPLPWKSFILSPYLETNEMCTRCVQRPHLA